MKIASLLLLIAASGLAAGKPDAKTLMKLDTEFCQAFQQKGVAGWLEYWGQDAVVFPQRGPIQTGILAATKYYQAVFGDRKGGLTWTPVGGHMSQAGDLGFTYGTWVSGRKGPDGKPETVTGKYFTTWKKQKDGSWKIVADIGQPDAPEKK
jgi:ketosteroid isomerase-like protein